MKRRTWSTRPQLPLPRGLRVIESTKAKQPGGGAGSVLSILLKTSSDEHLVTGAVLHKHAPRLLNVDGIDVEAPLERNLIYMRNRDVPGVIGQVGTILGKHKVNIANFSLGRRRGATDEKSKRKAREAIAVVHVDGRVPEGVLKVLRKVERSSKQRRSGCFSEKRVRKRARRSTFPVENLDTLLSAQSNESVEIPRGVGDHDRARFVASLIRKAAAWGAREPINMRVRATSSK